MTVEIRYLDSRTVELIQQICNDVEAFCDGADEANILCEIGGYFAGMHRLTKLMETDNDETSD